MPFMESRTVSDHTCPVTGLKLADDYVAAALAKHAPNEPLMGFDQEQEFREHLSDLCNDIAYIAASKGFWDRVYVLEKLALIASEVGEAIEAARSQSPQQSVKIPNHSMLAEELADIVIRVLDLATALDIDIPLAIVQKHRYNISRPRMHGGKKA